MKKAQRQATVEVVVLVDGQEAMRGSATVPGCKRGSVSGDALAGTIRSAALRSVAQAPLLYVDRVSSVLHAVYEADEVQP